MADIRENGTKGRSDWEVKTGRVRPSAVNAEIDANLLANSTKKWGIRIFGRLHIQQFDCRELAQATADKIGGELVEIN